MKKIFLYSMMLGMSAFGFTSCNDDDDQLTDSRLTYYVNLELQGDDFVQVPIGSNYNDAGCKATENGADVSANIKVSGLDAIDVNTAGIYTVTYTAVNKDGFPASVSRTVAVCDPSITTDLSGTWTTQDGTQRDNNKGTLTPYAGYTTKVALAAPGIFKVSDFLSGYYDQRAGYGSSYACSGYMQLLADGTLKCLSNGVPGWGDALDDFAGNYDASTETMVWDADYAAMRFHSVLTK